MMSCEFCDKPYPDRDLHALWWDRERGHYLRLAPGGPGRIICRRCAKLLYPSARVAPRREDQGLAPQGLHPSILPDCHRQEDPPYPSNVVLDVDNVRKLQTKSRFILTEAKYQSNRWRLDYWEREDMAGHLALKALEADDGRLDEYVAYFKGVMKNAAHNWIRAHKRRLARFDLVGLVEDHPYLH